MGKSKDHKAAKAKARQEALRKQKAAVAAQPRLLRQHPSLAAALSPRHPLIGYFVNDDWIESRLASIHIIREADTGEVAAGFLVDLLERGLKDAYGNYGRAGVLNELQDSAQKRGHAVVPLATETGVNLIRGGVAWAQRWHFPLPAEYALWLRLVDPVPAWGLDLGVFGEGGERPIRPLTREEYDRAVQQGDLVPEEPPEEPGALWRPPGSLTTLDDLTAVEDESEDDEAAAPPWNPVNSLWLPGSGVAEDAVAPPALWRPGDPEY